MEIVEQTAKATVGFDAVDLPPIVVCELTRSGWRGLTADGEILNVASNGAAVQIPTSVAISRNGQTVGYRALPKQTSDGVIDAYERHLRTSAALQRDNDFEQALTEIDSALQIAPTATARLNRAIVLLSLGRWGEGFDELAAAEQSELFMRPLWREAISRGLQPWRGELLNGKRLLLISDHGFGDAIMMLRFVPMLHSLGAEVTLMVPEELRRLAAQVAPVTANSLRVIETDYVCSLLFLMQHLRLSPAQFPTEPYLKADSDLVRKWSQRLQGRAKKIGVAWSVGVHHTDDYPRAIPLGMLAKALGSDGVLFSAQLQGEAEADLYGVGHFQFADFADCAAFMTQMDAVVTIDTAALHLAGAIGHPQVTALLSHWHSWRWLSPLYGGIKILTQNTPGDWDSALAKRKKEALPQER